jgi:hypothetical protein
MWMILGFLAIGFTISNIYLYVIKKDYELAMALALSFTALTLCSFNDLVSYWVVKGDMSALLDVVPYTTPALWVLTLISIFLNMIPIIMKKNIQVKKI